MPRPKWDQSRRTQKECSEHANVPKVVKKEPTSDTIRQRSCSPSHPGIIAVGLLLPRHLGMRMMRLALPHRPDLQCLEAQVAFPSNSVSSPINNLPAVSVVQGRIRHGGEDGVADVDVIHPTAATRIHDLDVLGQFLRVGVPDADVVLAFGVCVGVAGPALLHQGEGEGDDHFRVGVVRPAGGCPGGNLVVGHFALVRGGEGCRKGEAEAEGEDLGLHGR